ncbi:MAG: polyprenyl synthetase family protein [bacterium]|nr:polyprenyl synthetase family protein [bacterium]
MILFEEHMRRTAHEAEAFLGEFLSSYGIMRDEAAYCVCGGGKRFRPALSMIFAESADSRGRNDILSVSCALELVHSFSLVHDDLPEMDSDPVRRGKASCHARFGHAEALLGGDWLFAAAFRMLGKISSSEIYSKACGIISEASMKMIEGQLLEMRTPDVTIESIIKIHELKTGALIKGAVALGALCSESDSYEGSLEEYASDIGLLFQLTDDYLDFDEGGKNLAFAAGRDNALKMASDIVLRAKEKAMEYGRHEKLLVSAADFLAARIGL